MTSTYNLVVLTVERYIEIVHPIYHKVSFKRIQVYCAMGFVWVFGIGYNILLTSLTSGVTASGKCAHMTNWPSEFARKATAVITFAVEYFVPLLIMVWCYSKISWVIKNKAKIIPSGNNASTYAPNVNVRSSEMSKAKRNVIKTLFIVSLSFVACWTWNQVFFLLYSIGYKLSMTTWLYHFTVYAAFINCCINPFIYTAHLNSFRNSVSTLFRCSTNSRLQHCHNSSAN